MTSVQALMACCFWLYVQHVECQTPERMFGDSAGYENVEN